MTEDAKGVLEEPMLERAIGVIYRPESERTSHYFRAWLTRQFDAVLHFDESHALYAAGKHGPLGRGRAARDVPLGPVSPGPHLQRDRPQIARLPPKAAVTPFAAQCLRE